MNTTTGPLRRLTYDDHSHPHTGTTVPQLTLLVIWLGAIFYWLLRRTLTQTPRAAAVTKSSVQADDCHRSSNTVTTTSPASAVGGPLLPIANRSDCVPNGVPKNAVSAGKLDDVTVIVENTVCAPPSAEKTDADSAACLLQGPDADGKLDGGGRDGDGSGRSSSAAVTGKTKQNFSTVLPPPTLDEFLLQVIMLGAIMIYFYLCDYQKVFIMGERVYSRDTFLFMIFLLFLVGCGCTLRPTSDKILNRDHTEEWKGWMQVMFVWYHFFAAKEWYNWIRIYIACYVWMTGFGNFSFFWVRKDFSAWRAVKMLFRLDFLVLVVCAAVSNEYMVYYICAMHTYWFISVYCVMGVFSSWNQSRVHMAAKLLIYAAFNAIIFDVPSVAGYVFRPLAPILRLDDNPHDDLHEWIFRAGLDHWVCFVGMLCAYNYPYWESFIKFLEGDFNSRGRWSLLGVAGRGDLVKCVVVAVLGGLFAVWYAFILPLEKFTYNRVHPYTSWMPIVVYIVGRNLWPALRTRYVHLFAWLGKVTLETYLSQLHIYLQSNAKHLITYLPGYPLLNFALSTIIYLSASYKLFHITTEFSAFLLPQDRRLMVRNAGCALVVLAVAALAASLLRLSQIA